MKLLGYIWQITADFHHSSIAAGFTHSPKNSAYSPERTINYFIYRFMVPFEN